MTETEEKTTSRKGFVEIPNATIFGIVPGRLQSAVISLAKEKYPHFIKLISGTQVGDSVKPLRLEIEFLVPIKLLYTRDELIDICERAIIPQKLWEQAQTEKVQKDIGRCWQLLKCRCDYQIIGILTEGLIGIHFFVHSQEWFEHGDNPEDTSEYTGFSFDSDKNDLGFHLPTPDRLEKFIGKDWTSDIQNILK